MKVMVVFLASVGLCGVAYAGIQEAEISFLRRDYNKTIRECEAIAGSADYASAEKAYFLKGQSHLKQNQLQEARRSYGAILSDFPRGKFRDDAQLGIADTYFAEGEFHKAIEEYQILLEVYTKTPLVAIAIYKLGRCYAKLGMREKKEFYFQKLLRDYPLSFEAKLIE